MLHPDMHVALIGLFAVIDTSEFNDVTSVVIKIQLLVL